MSWRYSKANKGKKNCMSKDYLASDDNSINISLLVDGDEHITDGPAPNFWRVTQSDDQSGTGLILCMKCHELVDLRIKEKVLWCECTECHIVNIEDTLEDPDDDEDVPRFGGR
jgi:hypothetical protein